MSKNHFTIYTRKPIIPSADEVVSKSEPPTKVRMQNDAGTVENCLGFLKITV